MLIATLIAAGRLDERMVAGALDRLPGAAFLRWIDEGDAADFSIRNVDGAKQAFEEWEGCDVVVQHDIDREKRMLVADMDSTMIGQECIDELAGYAGRKPEIAAITERAMRGELDFSEALSERVALLRGLDVATISRCLAERIRPSPGAETLTRTMRARGAHTLLVSGGFADFVEPIAHQLGFAEFRANVLARDGSSLDGTTVGPIIDSIAKKVTMAGAAQQLGIDNAQILAIGDGANDLPMIEAAGLGVAYRAKPVLRAKADARLDQHGLDALLWAQGIARQHWVTG